MHRRWLTAVLFALALAVQALAPVATGVAMAHGAGESGPFELCLKAGRAAANHHGSGGHVHRQHDSCALCQAFCDGVAPVSVRSASLGMAPVRWTSFRWTVADRTVPVAARDYARQARAPPVFS